jgi:Spy/CpxP family protein refolding chaperone
MRQWIRAVVGGCVGIGLLGTLALAQPHAYRERGWPGELMSDGPGMLLPVLLRGVDLTPVQREQVHTIMAAHRKVFPKLFRQLRAEHDDLAARLLAPGEVTIADLTAQTQRITQLREQLLQEGLQVVVAVRKVLTSEQLVKAAQIKKRLHELQEEMRGLLPNAHGGADQEDARLPSSSR